MSELSSHKPRMTMGFQEPPGDGGGKKRLLSRAFGESMAEPTPQCQASSLQNGERRHFGVVKSPSVWFVVMAGLGNMLESLRGSLPSHLSATQPDLPGCSSGPTASRRRASSALVVAAGSWSR